MTGGNLHVLKGGFFGLALCTSDRRAGQGHLVHACRREVQDLIREV